jgi:hypothetical protein
VDDRNGRTGEPRPPLSGNRQRSSSGLVRLLVVEPVDDARLTDARRKRAPTFVLARYSSAIKVAHPQCADLESVGALVLAR